MKPVAVVTGAASGVGAACVNLLMSRGWRVVGLDLALPEATASDALTSYALDVRSPEDIERAFAEIGAEFGGIDALVCSAGILRVGPVETMSVADFDDVFDVNMRGAWLCARAGLPLLRKRATAETPGRIVFISSVAVMRPKIGTGLYSASKAALSQMTRVLAGEVASDGILVNALAPGSMDTPMTRGARKAGAETYKASGLPPLGRHAVPDDIARSVAMLLGPDATFITGVTIAVDGGASAVYLPGS